MMKESNEKAVASTREARCFQFCTFHVAGRHYGVDILKVKEITGETAFTPVFHAPKEVKGYVNIRGLISLVIDLRPLLGFESVEPGESSRVVLFKPEVGEAFGALVDSVGDVLSVPSTSIEWSSSEDDASAQSGQGEGCIGAGVCKLDGDLLLLLDPAKMLQSVQEKVLA